MTRSSRYALPAAERGTGTISAGQRWYGLRRESRNGPGRTSVLEAPTAEHPGPICAPALLLTTTEEVVGVASLAIPIIARPHTAVSAVTE